MQSNSNTTTLVEPLKVAQKELVDLTSLYEKNSLELTATRKELRTTLQEFSTAEKEMLYLDERTASLQKEIQELKSSKNTNLSQERYLSELEHTLAKKIKKREEIIEKIKNISTALPNIKKRISDLKAPLNEVIELTNQLKTKSQKLIPDLPEYKKATSEALEKKRIELEKEAVARLVEDGIFFQKKIKEIKRESLKALSKNTTSKDNSSSKTPKKAFIGDNINAYIFSKSHPSFFKGFLKGV
jgi:regulator of replication initiation timing